MLSTRRSAMWTPALVTAPARKMVVFSTPGVVVVPPRPLVARSGRAPPPRRPAGGPIRVGNRTFERLRKLGQGSFGTVWEVRECSAAGVHALKRSTPSNPDTREACLLEVELLRSLTTALPHEVADAGRVPAYVTHAHTSEAVDVVMTKLQGRPLDQWLYGVDENAFKTLDMAQVLEGPFPKGAFQTRTLAGACSLVANLLSQMAPVFKCLNQMAYHRDISAHNFLIREEEGRPHLAILDFGLAVRAPGWAHECRHRSVAGDPRYFTPGAWMLVAGGWRSLEAHPSLLKQYKKRIDHYSMGLVALETLFALWGESPAEDGHATLAKAKKAWHALWADAVQFFQMVHGPGPAATREALERSQAVSTYVDKLKALVSTLYAASAAFSGPARPVAAVLGIAAGLIDPMSELQWNDLAELLPAEGPSGAGPGQAVTYYAPPASSKAYAPPASPPARRVIRSVFR